MSETLLGVLIGAAAAIVGGGIAGLIPYWLSNRQWVRLRSAHHMEEFYAQASGFVERVNPWEQGQGGSDATSGSLRRSAAVLSIYAPRAVVFCSNALVRMILEEERDDDPGLPWQDWEWAKQIEMYENWSRALAVYESQMRRVLGVGTKNIRPGNWIRGLLPEKWAPGEHDDAVRSEDRGESA